MCALESEQQNAQNYTNMIREDLVQTAVKFLENRNVINTPLTQKQKFLQRKGLTDAEIQVACERAGAYTIQDRQNKDLPAIPPSFNYISGSELQTITWFEKFKGIVHNVGIISIVAYAIYRFYEKFIKPFLFGGKRKKTVEEEITEINKIVTSSITELKDTLVEVKVEESNTQRQLNDLKSEISTVKGLLLSRKQFPSVSSTPVVPPSIPAWQLSSVQPDPDPDPDTMDAKSEDLMEIGSGSGSSEHEQGTKNSDSSLEIM